MSELNLRLYLFAPNVSFHQTFWRLTFGTWWPWHIIIIGHSPWFFFLQSDNQWESVSQSTSLYACLPVCLFIHPRACFLFSQSYCLSFSDCVNANLHSSFYACLNLCLPFLPHWIDYCRQWWRCLSASIHQPILWSNVDIHAVTVIRSTLHNLLRILVNTHQYSPVSRQINLLVCSYVI
jgi:hypothetical protein